MASTTATFNEETLEILERRLGNLERHIYGADAKKEAVRGSEPFVERLNEVAKDCGNALESRERIAPLLRRITELESYLDPTFGESKGLSAQCKVDLILANEERLKRTNNLLNKVVEQRSALDSEAIRDVPRLEPKLVELSKIQVSVFDQLSISQCQT